MRHFVTAIIIMATVVTVPRAGAVDDVAVDMVRTNPAAGNTERFLPPDEVFNLWVQDETFFKPREEDHVELRKTVHQEAETFKLDKVVPPIGFASGQADIPAAYVTKLREVLDGMKGRANVRLHFIGHTDNAPLREAAAAQYGDNIGLSRARAEIAAEYFKQALGLAPEAVSYDGVGDAQPIASNDTEAGRAKNRRVEVQVWYDKIKESVTTEKVVVPAPGLNRVKVCRQETVCTVRYKSGGGRRTKLKNLVPPLRLDEGQAEVPDDYIRRVKEVLDNLRDRGNVVIRFIGHTDNLPLTEREKRIYGGHLAMSKARARRVALVVQDRLGLPNAMVSVDGRGAERPVAPNDSMKGRALNRRVELEFWYDDPFDRTSVEPQACPEAPTAETVTRIYEPPTGPINALRFENGDPVIPPGYLERLKRLLDEVAATHASARLNFVGYTSNERMDRRTAMVYRDDIGLSTARARRVMEAVRDRLSLDDSQVQYEGRGFVHSRDVVNTGFVQLEGSRVEVEILYDELAELDDEDGVDITRIDREAKAENPYALNLMRITVDGQPIHDPHKSVADLQRCTDVALDKADIQFRFDNLSVKPRLNVTAWPNAIHLRTGGRVRFRGYSNYAAFVSRAEVRVFAESQSSRDEPLAVIPLDEDWRGEWQPATDAVALSGRELKYLLRVYDRSGRFDETQPQALWILEESGAVAEDAESDGEAELSSGYGENRIAVENIPVQGGTVAVHGDSIPADHTVWVAGRPVPVDPDGHFVSEEILPKGLHTVEVAVLDGGGNGDLYLRDLALSRDDWFYVGIADITAVRDRTNGPAQLITGDRIHYDNDLSVDGRLAFYTKGDFGDGWNLTASADTREGPLKDLFTNFMSKSPDMLFRRMDPDYYYPTFGDDSTVEEDAATSGKFYLKLKRRDDYALWGNFNLEYTDNDLAHVDRGLYGFNGHFTGDETTSFGEKRLSVDGFAAQPGTVAGRDEFRGTGGSLYYLRHQDILVGSDRLRIEVRDRDSGVVLSVKTLVPAVDYDIDYVQGRILLGAPLASQVDDGQLVADGSLGGNPAYLVARYEYTPGFGLLDDMAHGGRIHYWFGEHVKLGLTASRQRELDNEQSLAGVDLTLRKNSGTWLKIEMAATRGPGTTELSSSDGGFTYDQISQGAIEGDKKAAARIEASTRLSDIVTGARGTAAVYAQTREAGFSAPGQLTANDIEQYGTRANLPLTERLELNLKADRRNQDQGLETTAVDVDATVRLDRHWSWRTGARVDRRKDNSVSVPVTQQQGERVDLAVETRYDSLGRWSAFGFAQSTARSSGNRGGNDRVGTGGRFRVTDRLNLDGEVSTGELGTGAKLGTEYLVSDRTNIYLNYALENERTDSGVRARRGNLSSGFRTRYSDSASVYMEERYSYGDVPTGLTHAMGVDLAPNERWNFGASLEVGTLEDPQTAAQTERQAYGLSAGYAFDAATYGGAMEYRIDDTWNGPGTSARRDTWLVRNSLKYQLSPNWRLLGKLNLSDSKSSQGEFYDGRFVESVLGYAYRPVANDRWNSLFKYTYFYNVPTADQVTAGNTAVEYLQKSHIVSIDALYDLNTRWSLGGKYAYRLGQVSQERVDPVFFDSRASLYVLRADWHVLFRWDVLMEARLLDLPDAADRRSGVLLGAYRHLGENLKLGLGYNFTDFSDDLTDLSFDSQGLFVNLVGKI